MLRALPPRSPAPRGFISIQEFAAQRGLAASTVYRWADSGEMDGRDAAHPQAVKERGRWKVAPHCYREQAAPSAEDAALDALAARVAPLVAQLIARRLSGQGAGG